VSSELNLLYSTEMFLPRLSIDLSVSRTTQNVDEFFSNFSKVYFVSSSLLHFAMMWFVEFRKVVQQHI